jgi:hypothetical protein
MDTIRKMQAGAFLDSSKCSEEINLAGGLLHCSIPPGRWFQVEPEAG